ncbi:LexA family protein [Dinghuibacter silviterrae]|uniref:SOS response UmuD protein n=1 Tax=Dinghuibacter silviterrae TaxID=1539049 RepID=A0A4R8DUL7_9BACT|nr:translesion error-prone DNA polymerase V autoproteolytic subunit [Dinghuibacter silviterrae]TDX02082.1 SOS response UmuD protein [Dinghuibacter silviterrae]
MELPVLLLPVFPGTIPTGFPSPAEDYMEERINLNDLVSHPDSTFVVRSQGYSMINAFIPPNAMLLVDKSITPKNNDIVVASVNGDFTIKYLKVNDHKQKLVPANSKYKEIEIVEGMDFRIWGVVTHVISDPKNLKDVC